MTRRHDPFDRLRGELGRAAMRQSPTPRTTARRWQGLARRPLTLAAAGLLVTGTATAAVLSSSDSTSELSAAARPDAPAAPNLRSLNQALDALPAQIPAGPARSGPAGATTLPAPPTSEVRGATIAHGSVTVDVSITDTRICLAPTSALQRGAAGPLSPESGTDRVLACAPLPASSERLAFVRGTGSDQSWIAAIAPDGVTAVTVTDETGTTTPANVDRNVAIASVPAGRIIKKISWQRPGGELATLTVGDTPDNATQATVQPLQR